MDTLIHAQRYHDFSYGHRVHGHESKCAHLHGHNGRVHFTVRSKEHLIPLDAVGRVMDFSAIKDRLCMWVEREWDHKFLVSSDDPLAAHLKELDPDGVVTVPFNPTAENMAQYLLEVVGPDVLIGTGVRLVQVRVEETRKCSALASNAGL